ncbi:unnamed protein product, partial [Meganyctiphanes norvegica]
MPRGREGSSGGGAHGREGSPGRPPGRPQSWCVAMSAPLHRQEPNDRDREAALAGRGLHRSSSYQALHSALSSLYRIDDFTMEKIGAGFFSEVFKVRHRVTGDIMVLKMNKLMSNRHNMLREVELMNRLHHPNILRYHGVCVNEGQVHALTEYINGGPMDDLLGDHSQHLPWHTRISLALDTARGMAYLHRQGVMHRDLTSKNVLIKHSIGGGEKKMMAVIADFGLAAAIPKDESIRLHQVGSPYWMAPEVIRGDWYDQRVDVFSFGICVCQIIARCDADPDILPRTHNFGVHYLAFSQLCQADCPPTFLKFAFQCCQIEPGSRPTFKDLTVQLESLINKINVTPQVRQTQRKHKLSHRRSLSDESFVILRCQQMDAAVVGPTSGHTVSNASSSAAGTVAEARSTVTTSHDSTQQYTPHQILTQMSVADPYFQEASSNVNPFTRVKLPARSLLALQEGLRYCHSLPEPAQLSQVSPSTPTVPFSPTIRLLQTHTSDSSLCPHPVSGSTATHPHQHHQHTHCRAARHLAVSSGSELHSKQCTCSSITRRNNAKEEVTELKCTYHGVRVLASPAALWLRDLSRTPCNTDDEGPTSSSSPRSDIGSGGESVSLHTPQLSGGGVIRRRGSGESGFFSVGDLEGRLGTPELCLSFSELSTCSLLSLEEDIDGHLCVVHRSSSVVTDSSEDLSSLGCCYDASHHSCDLASLTEGEDGNMRYTLTTDYEGEKDIRNIVEFFERNGGSGRSSNHLDTPKNCVVSSRTRRQGCLVPLLTNKFSAMHGNSVAHSAATQYSHSVTNPPSQSNNLTVSKSFITKESAIPKSARLVPPTSRSERTIKVKERPKVYITEGTVRAKRDIFEAK